MTDPDGAGFVIRNHLKGALPPEQILQAYVPDVHGKERRKRKGGKEGKLGVEGMPPAVLLEALRRCGATWEGEEAPAAPLRLTKAESVGKGTDRPQLRRPAAGAVQETESAGAHDPQRPFAGAEHAADGGGVGGAVRQAAPQRRTKALLLQAGGLF